MNSVVILLFSSVSVFAQFDCKDLAPHECAQLRSMAQQKELPPSPGNRVADSEKAAALGFRIFHDARFSSNNDVRCASCHQPEKYFGDGLPVSKAGIRPLKRNSPTLLNAARMRLQFWDGRADSLWSQALGPTENKDEMNFDRTAVAHRLARSYKPAYEALFGRFPDLNNRKRFPEHASPKSDNPAFAAAWAAMSPEDQKTINNVFANYGKVIEAYIRRIASGPSAFDAWIHGKMPLSRTAQNGARLFLRKGCVDCHSGSNFTSEHFYAVLENSSDPGLESGELQYLADPFRQDGDYADTKSSRPAALVLGKNQATKRSAFRTPSLRNIAVSGPYGHNGDYATIRAVISAHQRPDGKIMSITDDEHSYLEAFLRSLTGEGPRPPWSHWPDR